MATPVQASSVPDARVSTGIGGLDALLSRGLTPNRYVIDGRHGWWLDGIELFQLQSPQHGNDRSQYTLYHPAEVELGETGTPRYIGGNGARLHHGR